MNKYDINNKKDILKELSLFFEKEINENNLNMFFTALMDLYYNHFKDYSTKKEFKQNSKTQKMEFLIKILIKEYPYLKKLKAYGGLK